MLRATEIIGVKLTGWRRIKGSAEEARMEYMTGTLRLHDLPVLAYICSSYIK